MRDRQTSHLEKLHIPIVTGGGEPALISVSMPWTACRASSLQLLTQAAGVQHNRLFPLSERSYVRIMRNHALYTHGRPG
jgi:hypothetical protein